MLACRAMRFWTSSLLLGLACFLGPAVLTAQSGGSSCELISNGGFEGGSIVPWKVQKGVDYGYATYRTLLDPHPGNEGNRLLEIQASGFLTAPDYALEISQTVQIEAGARYRISFWGNYQDGAPRPQSAWVGVKVGRQTAPYASLGFDQQVEIHPSSGTNFSREFTATATDASAGFVIFLGGNPDGTFRFDSFSLEKLNSADCGEGGNTGGSGGTTGGTGGSSGGTGGSTGGTGGTTGGSGGSSGGTGGTTGGTGGGTGSGPVEPSKPGSGPLQIRVNQLAYLENAEKRATLISNSEIPLTWELLDSSGKVQETGTTRPTGQDALSEDWTHVIDFSSAQVRGEHFRLRVESSLSPSFAIRGNLYERLRRDALRFFYHQRASTAITQLHAEEAQWVRSFSSSHPHADSNVRCRAGECLSLYGTSYSLDVRGGWYDAGDYGKYVVNGGIAVWTLLNAYERSVHLGRGVTHGADATSNIPESGNQVPDILDEARYELEFLLRMQVKQGLPLAGMAHHKMHGLKWGGVPLLPHLDDTGRALSAPSTAATLNLAAVAAQAARIYEKYDSAFARRCLQAAERAYQAALDNPDIFAINTGNSESGDDLGGGPYDDDEVSDEFYWAAAELWLTTGNKKYLSDWLESVHNQSEWGANQSAFNWKETAGLGALSLAVVPSEGQEEAIVRVQQRLLRFAELLAARAAAGYGSAAPFAVWGSNSEVLNTGLVQAVVYDLTGEARFRRGALGALDSVLGRNPLNQSYITGYGLPGRFQNPHHRMWAPNPLSPSSRIHPPPGVLAGGPNVNLDGLGGGDPLRGCKPTRCWRDDPDAYGMTEVTINWNAPLAWLAGWAEENAKQPLVNFPGIPEDGENPVRPGGPEEPGEPVEPGGKDRPSKRPSDKGDDSEEEDEDSSKGSGRVGSEDDESESGDSEGCGCAQVGLSSSSGAAWWSLGLLSWWALRRRGTRASS